MNRQTYASSDHIYAQAEWQPHYSLNISPSRNLHNHKLNVINLIYSNFNLTTFTIQSRSIQTHFYIIHIYANSHSFFLVQCHIFFCFIHTKLMVFYPLWLIHKQNFRYHDIENWHNRPTAGKILPRITSITIFQNCALEIWKHLWENNI